MGHGSDRATPKGAPLLPDYKRRGQQYPTGGDVITEIDGKKVESAEDLQSAIDAKRPDDTVTLTVVRGGDRREVDVKLASRPASTD